MSRTRSWGVPALLALVLAGLISAAPAPAAKFVSGNSTVNFEANTGPLQEIALHSAGVTKCASPTFTGTAEGTMTADATFAIDSLAPWSTGTGSCSGSTMSWNKCNLIMHPPTEGTTNGTVEIGPSGCGSVDLVRGIPNCSFKIPAQTGIGATYTNESGAVLHVAIKTNSLKHVLESGFCGTKGTTYNDGGWYAGFSIKTNVGLWVEELPVGVRVDGEESENPFEQPRFVPEISPTSMTGELAGTHEFKVNAAGSTLKCTSGTLAGELPSPVTSMDVSTTYTGCAKGFGIDDLTVDMNSCRYAFALDNVGPPYSGTAEVVCDEEGDAIEFLITKYCTYELAPQALGTATYVTTGGYNETRILAEVKGSGVTYVRTLSKSLCPKPDAGGAFSGGFSLGGVE